MTIIQNTFFHVTVPLRCYNTLWPFLHLLKKSFEYFLIQNSFYFLRFLVFHPSTVSRPRCSPQCCRTGWKCCPCHLPRTNYPSTCWEAFWVKRYFFFKSLTNSKHKLVLILSKIASIVKITVLLNFRNLICAVFDSN